MRSTANPNDSWMIRMEKGGLEKLHVDVRRLIDASSNPASPEAQRVAARYLKFCEAQSISDPASFAQLLSQYPNLNPERGDADVHRAQWEFNDDFDAAILEVLQVARAGSVYAKTIRESLVPDPPRQPSTFGEPKNRGLLRFGVRDRLLEQASKLQHRPLWAFIVAKAEYRDGRPALISRISA